MRSKFMRPRSSQHFKRDLRAGGRYPPSAEASFYDALIHPFQISSLIAGQESRTQFLPPALWSGLLKVRCRLIKPTLIWHGMNLLSAVLGDPLELAVVQYHFRKMEGGIERFQIHRFWTSESRRRKQIHVNTPPSLIVLFPSQPTWFYFPKLHFPKALWLTARKWIMVT